MKPRGDLKGLRKKASDRLKQGVFGRSKPPVRLDRKNLLSELSIHQMELEMQNHELRESREEIERVKEWYFSLFDLAPIPYFVFTKDQMIHELNFAAAQLLRRNRASCKSLRLGSFLDGASADALRDHLYSVFHDSAEKAHAITLRLECGEDYLDLEMTSQLVKKGWTGEPMCLSSCVDVTQRNRTLTELRAAKGAAEAAAAAKAEFLANMSHEMRTPLTSVLMFAQLMKRKSFTAEKKDSFLDGIVRNATHLNALIGDILDLSKLEAGRLDIEPTTVQLRVLAREIIESLQPLAAAKSLALELSISEEMPELVIVDPLRLKQILLNLLGNAVKFTSSGKVSLAIARASDERFINFDVNDTGIGISPEAQAQLFTQFTQADSSTSRRFGGTGLGLYLSRRLAHHLRGELLLLGSTPGEGSQFRLVLPLERADGTRKLRAVEPPVVVGGSLNGVRMLVVENSSDTPLALGEFLTKEGAKVSYAKGGDEAITKCEPSSFDVVLMDVQMPIVDGYMAARALREKGIRVPLIAFTSNPTSEVKQKIFECGFDDFLSKPITLAALKSTLLRFVSEP